MNNNTFKIEIDYLQISDKDKCPIINITDGETFDYSNIRFMYKKSPKYSGNGHGIQVNNPKHEKILLKMCDIIADAIYHAKDKITKENENG